LRAFIVLLAFITLTVVVGTLRHAEVIHILVQLNKYFVDKCSLIATLPCYICA